MTITLENIEIKGRNHPFFSLACDAGKASSIHFTGANGFPVAVYHDFLNRFTNHHPITAADCRGAFKERNTPPTPFGFPGFADDLIEIIEQTHSEPVIGMGHSFGAHISLIAAIKRPDLFEQLILIEPASLPNSWVDFVYRKLPKFVLHRMVPMIKQTQQRQQLWPDQESFISRYTSHRTFKHFTDDAMRDYAKHGLRMRSDGQYELIFDPDWEAYIFSKVEFVWNNLKRSQTPCLFLRAEHSNLYSSNTFNTQNKALRPHFTGIEVENTHHLMPFESPKLCSKTILDWLTLT